MSQTKFTLWLSFLAVCVACCYGQTDGGKSWVVLVAGSNGYNNYRHQADVCHFYQVVKARGIPDENIIVMIYDDIANNKDNPIKGKIFNKPRGPNVYDKIPKDYVGNAVTPDNFLKVLSGKAEGMKAVGSGKVVKSTDQDTIFVYYSDHGGPGIIAFIKELLYAQDLLATLENMKNEKCYKKILIAVEACYSGSMFQNLLATDTKVYAMTAANSAESSYSRYYDPSVKAYLGDEYSTYVMEILDIVDDITINKLYDTVKSRVKGSHVEKFGDLGIAADSISTFIGKKKSLRSIEVPERFKQHQIHDAVRTFDVPIVELREKIKAAGSPHERREYEDQIETILSKRKIVHSIMHDILMSVADNDAEKHTELEQMQYSITRQNMYCTKNLTKTFHENCFNVAQSPYTAEVLGDLIKLCDVEWTSEDQIIDVIKNVCEEHEKPVNVI